MKRVEVKNVEEVQEYYRTHGRIATAKHFGIGDAPVRRICADVERDKRAIERNSVEQVKATLLERYGVSCGFGNCDKEKRNEKCWSDKARQKRASTNIARYGYDNVFRDKEKIRKANRTKYGVNNHVQKNIEHFAEWEDGAKRKEVWDKLGSVKCAEYFNVDLCTLYERRDIEHEREYRGNEEKEIADYIRSKGIEIELNKKVIYPREVDIYIPCKKIAIEVNGEFWHCDKVVPRDYHRQKWETCYNKGITLYTIWCEEWNTKKHIIKKHLDNILGIGNIEKCYARDTIICKPTQQEAMIFFNENHIQGWAKGAYYGLAHKGELVACVSVGVSRGNNKRTISRYATSKQVVGGFSKIVSYILKKYGELESTLDLQFGDKDDNVYISTGWGKVRELPINYTYIDPHGHKVAKASFTKANIRKIFPNIYDEKLSEFEMMDKTKYKRIWDCGKIVYRKAL